MHSPLMISASIDAFIYSSLLVVGPWLYFSFRARPKRSQTSANVPNGVPAASPGFANANGQQTQPLVQVARPSRRRYYLSLLIAAHTVFILWNLLVWEQSNLFQRFGIPLNTPSEDIRAFLLSKADGPALPRTLDTLLSRLSSFDARVYFVR